MRQLPLSWRRRVVLSQYLSRTDGKSYSVIWAPKCSRFSYDRMKGITWEIGSESVQTINCQMAPKGTGYKAAVTELFKVMVDGCAQNYIFNAH